MKKIVLFLVAVLPLFACNRELNNERDAKKINIEVFIEGVGTKATGITSNDPTTEAKVNTLQILVFNGDALDGYNSSTASSCVVTCSAGSRDIYAVVNGPDLSAVTSKAAMLATSVSLVENVANFVMVGHKTETLGESGSVSLTVDRLASRVVVHGVKNAHANGTLAADFELVSLYLTNACGELNLGMSDNFAVTTFYNRRGYEADNNLGGFTYDAVGSKIASGATNDTKHFFYTMPNRYDVAVGGVWSPRRAKLLIRVKLAGVLYDYPVVLPAMSSNKSYEINLLTITKNGNLDDGNHDYNDPDDTDEEKPVEGFDKTFTITVNNWDVVLLGDEGNVSI